MISIVHSNSSCFAFGCSPSGWPSPSTERTSVATLASSRVPRSTTSSSTSMPRLGPGELLKSICTRSEAYGTPPLAEEAALSEKTGWALRRCGRRGEAEVGPRRWGRHPAARGTEEQSLADEERFVHVLDGLGRLADRDGEGGEADRSPAEARAERAEHRPVDLVETALVHAEGGEPGLGGVVVDGTVAPHLGVVAHPAQQPVGDAGRAPGPPCDLATPVFLHGHLEDARGPFDDRLEVSGVVVVEPGDEAEAVAKGARDEAGAGGGADEGEVRDVEPDRARRRTFPEDDVELEVLHRRVEDLLHRPGQSVDLVDEEHVAVAELAEDGGEVAAPLEGRAGGDVEADVHLGGDDVGEARLAEAGRTGEQQVIGGLAAPAGGLEDDREVLLELRLAHEVVEPAGPQAHLR